MKIQIEEGKFAQQGSFWIY